MQELFHFIFHNNIFIERHKNFNTQKNFFFLYRIFEFRIKATEWYNKYISEHDDQTSCALMQKVPNTIRASAGDRIPKNVHTRSY